jgi:hypothetical protein
MFAEGITMSKPKYELGKMVMSIHEAILALDSNCVFYIPGGSKSPNGYKTVPSAFLEHWSVAQLKIAINYRRLYIAKPKEATCQIKP